MDDEKSPTRQAAEVGLQYLLPSGAVAGAVSILLSYFLKLPSEVVTAITVVLFAVINVIEVYIIERRKVL